jgi:hypothetical protein
VFMIIVTIVNCSAGLRGTLEPNRGIQLFVLIDGKDRSMHIIPVTPPQRSVVQRWHPGKGTYDFVSAVIRERSATGCKVFFTRYVMTDDYLPRTEHSELDFPYERQYRYAFFDIGFITGFYRNSVSDCCKEIEPQ